MPRLDQASLRNRLLKNLDADDFAAIQSHLEQVVFRLGVPLVAADEPPEFVYFLDKGIASHVARTQPVGSVELGLIGREGFVGAAIALGVEQSSHAAIIQMEGRGWRIPSGVFRATIAANPSLHRVFLRYVHAFMMQIASTAYANSDFNVEQRLARWLLMYADRIDGDEISVTHFCIALMINVRRPGVTAATHFLEGQGAIRATRGLIIILDRQKLEGIAGSSYGVAEAEYERLLGSETHRVRSP